MRRSVSSAFVLILALAGSAAAHYHFILPEKFRVAAGGSMIVGFHAADAFPESSRVPKALRSFALQTGSRSVPITGLRENGMRLVGTITPPAGYSIVTAMHPVETEEMKADEFTKYLKDESLTAAVESRAKLGETAKPGRERYSMYLKSIVLSGAPNEGYKQLTGQPIEIVPEKDPSSVRSGESLPVRVLFKGAPAPNLDLFAASKTKAKHRVGKTDSNGRISVPVAAGTWRLNTILMKRITEPTADWESFWATLTFEIP